MSFQFFFGKDDLERFFRDTGVITNPGDNGISRFNTGGRCGSIGVIHIVFVGNCIISILNQHALSVDNRHFWRFGGAGIVLSTDGVHIVRGQNFGIDSEGFGNRVGIFIVAHEGDRHRTGSGINVFAVTVIIIIAFDQLNTVAFDGGRRLEFGAVVGHVIHIANGKFIDNIRFADAEEHLDVSGVNLRACAAGISHNYFIGVGSCG